ncbi:asparagine synthase-related protein [Streptomyces sp. NPDC048275]|uniref:asparagine synthase-related protein n=1 Tax=Streptomyces sp. NPDC048275 TaxID=3155629 RepID=UPI0033D6FD5A
MSAESMFLVLPDGDCARAAARAVCALPGVRVIAHASGRPWVVGRWQADALRVVEAGQTRVVVAGFCPATTGELKELAARLGKAPDLATRFRGLAGSAHMAVSVAGCTGVRGTASGLRAVFHTRFAGVTVASDRPDWLAELTGADIDEDILALRMLAFAAPYPLSERPAWRGIEQLSPDHCLYLEPDGDTRTARWWSAPEPVLSLRQGAVTVREALAGAVRARVAAADGTVSTDLSGGMDSGTVTHLAAGTDTRARLLTVRTPQLDPGGDDALWAQRITQRLPEAEHLLLEYDRSPTMFAGLDTGSAIALAAEPPYWVRAGARFQDVCARITAHGSRMHLCGHGGDELFHPMPAYVHTLARSRPWTAIRHVRGWRALRRWPTAATWRGLADTRTFPEDLAHGAKQLRAPLPSPFEPRLSWTTPPRMPRWASWQAMETARRMLTEAAEQCPEPLANERGGHATLQSVRQCGAMVRYAARIMAIRGAYLEAPYLDDQVIEAALAVRPHERGTPDRFKPLLAEAMQGLVPADLLSRSTKGAYDEDTFDGLRRHRTTLLDLFDGSELGRRGLVDDAAVRTALRATHPTTKPLMMLEPTLACEVWLRSLSASARSRPRSVPAAEGAP